MMLIRLIIFAVLVTIVILIYRRLTQSSKQPPLNTAASMKKCSQCGVHIPEGEALKDDDHFFCSEAHRKLFIDQDSDD